MKVEIRLSQEEAVIFTKKIIKIGDASQCARCAKRIVAGSLYNCKASEAIVSVYDIIDAPTRTKITCYGYKLLG